MLTSHRRIPDTRKGRKPLQPPPNSAKGQRVEIYLNLVKTRKGDQYAVYSIKAIGGKVLGYAQAIQLDDCSFKVSEATRQRTLRLQKRTVHAMAIGTLADWSMDPVAIPDLPAISYNPYHAGYFYYSSDPSVPCPDHIDRLIFTGRKAYQI